MEVEYKENKAAEECSLMREIRLEEGCYDDWKQLAGFHYRSHNLAFPRQIFILKREDELCGVIGYSYPASTCFGRSKVFQPSSMQELNEKLSVIRQIVVHPKYRTIGLGRRLVEETLDKAETRYVELIAVMAQYNPFDEKAGTKKIAVKEGSKLAFQIADTLRDLGFNMQLIGSHRYVEKIIQSRPT
ncbi:MAG: GNAT family N-acetyltransferase [Thermoproteota archaeon]